VRSDRLDSREGLKTTFWMTVARRVALLIAEVSNLVDDEPGVVLLAAEPEAVLARPLQESPSAFDRRRPGISADADSDTFRPPPPAAKSFATPRRGPRSYMTQLGEGGTLTGTSKTRVDSGTIEAAGRWTAIKERHTFRVDSEVSWNDDSSN
jgi:hypothetical protein